jgi:hypothetical protein
MIRDQLFHLRRDSSVARFSQTTDRCEARNLIAAVGCPQQQSDDVGIAAPGQGFQQYTPLDYLRR